MQGSPRFSLPFFLTPSCPKRKPLNQGSGSPVILITDPGSENPVMAIMQSMLRSDGINTVVKINLHRFLESKQNERVEAWWSFYKRNRSAWWISLLKDLRGIFLQGNEYHKEYLWLCFSQLFQEDLQFVQSHWNTHYIWGCRFDTVAGICITCQNDQDTANSLLSEIDKMEEQSTAFV